MSPASRPVGPEVGADETHMSAAHSCLRPLQVESRCHRSAQGTLNRIKADLEHLLWYDHANIADLSGHRLGAWLANRPCSVKGRGVIWPQREMLGLLAALPPVADTGGRKDEAADLPDNVVSLRDYRRPEPDA